MPAFVHVKGFAKRLVPNDPAFQAALALPELQTCDTLAWDGDAFAEDSFTALIADLARRRPSMQLVAFFSPKSPAEQEHLPGHEEFDQTWGAAGLLHRIEKRPVEVPVGTDNAWEELGVAALRSTGAKTVVCLGGGDCVLRLSVDGDRANDQYL